MDWLKAKLEAFLLFSTVLGAWPIAMLVKDYLRVRKLAQDGAALVPALAKLAVELERLENRLREHEDCLEVHTSEADRENDRIVRGQILAAIQSLEGQVKEVRTSFMQWLQGGRRRG